MAVSRHVKVAISGDCFVLAEESLKSFLAKRPEVKLSLAKVPDDPDAALLQELFSGTEVALLVPSLFSKLSDCITSRTKWIQSTWAGVETLHELNAEQRARMEMMCTITKAGGVFPSQMSEYVVGAVISMERNLPLIYGRQLKKEWKKDSTVCSYRTMSQLSIGILGLGEIGREVAKACRGLGMTVYGLKRTPHACRHVEKVFALAELPELLGMCDYVCNILPATAETKGLLSGDSLKSCAAKRPGFINVGRGNIISEDSLITALNNCWISKAFLDVFEVEPLDKSSALWSMENVTITPHVAGHAMQNLVANLFVRNLEKYIDGLELDYVYSWEKGY